MGSVTVKINTPLIFSYLEEEGYQCGINLDHEDPYYVKRKKDGSYLNLAEKTFLLKRIIKDICKVESGYWNGVITESKNTGTYYVFCCESSRRGEECECKNSM